MHPPPDTDADNLPAGVRLRIDRACVAFERAWKSGGTPRIEDVCPGDDSAEARVLFAELLHLDVEYRRRRGDAPALAEYLGRFPDRRELVAAVWADTVPGTGDAARPLDVPGYVVQGVLGCGGMGVVYRAWQTALNRPVALKVIRGGLHATAAEQARFRAEADAVAQLQHPNIVAIYDVGTSGGQLYLALEYVAGGTLASRNAGVPQPARPAAQVVRTLADAVAHAHARGVVHRDLKPGNVLLADDGRPMIADFGLARRVGDDRRDTQTGEVVGTPSYLAPEQARGERAAVAPAVDIYALGAILYDLLTGRPPFRGPSPYETIRQVIDHEPPAVRQLQPGVPRDLETICLKCLHKDPARRYSSAADLSADLGRFLDGRPILARPVGVAGRGWRAARRRPVVAALLAALLLGGVAGLATWYRFTVQLTAAQAEITTQRDRAVENLAAARAAVQTFLRNVNHDPKFKETASAELRHRLLALAAKYYDELPADHADDPAVLNEKVSTVLDLARATHLLGNEAEADALVRRADHLSRRLLELAPDSHAVLLTVADARNSRGFALAKGGDAEAARSEYRAAIAAFERVLPTAADANAVRLNLSHTYSNLGVAHRMMKDLAAAEACHRQALALREQLPQDVPDHANAVAASWHNLAAVYQLTGRLDEAERHYRLAVERREDVLRRTPDYPEYAMSLASSLHSLGMLLKDRRRLADAAENFRRCVAVLEPLDARHPNIAGYRYALDRARKSLASVERSGAP